MLDAATAEILKAGLGYVLFLFACGVIALMQKRNDVLQSQCSENLRQSDKDLMNLNEKRLEETKAIVLAIERSTQAANERSASAQALATAVTDLTKGFAALVLTQEGSRAQFIKLGERLEARQEQALDLLRKLSTGK